MDVLRYIGAVTHEVRSSEKDCRPARVVVAGCSYDTNIEDLWDAITNPERIARWFLPISGELRVGGRYQLQGNAGGEITACDPPRHLEVTWEFGGQLSWVHIELTELSDGGTRLRLEHTHTLDDLWREYGPGAVGVGWDLTLMGLERHLSPGTAAWQEPEAQKELIRQSSQMWGEASIAAGTEEAAARAAAERTTKFYGGV
jgi:uncharacterized protein YndB with AHSA1/START domain